MATAVPEHSLSSSLFCHGDRQPNCVALWRQSLLPFLRLTDVLSFDILAVQRCTANGRPGHRLERGEHVATPKIHSRESG
jgi:hypothetical protein